MQTKNNNTSSIEFVSNIKFERDRIYLEWPDVLRRSNSSFDDIEQAYWNYTKCNVRASATARNALKQLLHNYLWGAKLVKELLVSIGEIEPDYDDSSMNYFYELDKQQAHRISMNNASPTHEVVYSFNESFSSIYATNSSLYCVDYIINKDISDQKQAHRQVFRCMYSAMSEDFNRLSMTYGPSYVHKNPDRQLIGRLASFLELWFSKRYDASKYGVKLDSCYTMWLDTLLIAFAVTCVLNDVDSRLYMCNSLIRSVLSWSDTGGYVQDGEMPFHNDGGAGVPKDVACYNMYSENYDITNNILAMHNLNQSAIALAVYFEDLIKPVLFSTSIASLTEASKSTDPYLHSIRQHSISKLNVPIRESVSELEEECQCFITIQ